MCYWYENSAPDLRIFWIYENYPVVRIVLLICFQRAHNYFPILSQTQIIPIFVFWAQNAQIWKFGPRSPDFQKMLNIVKFLELPY